MNINLLGTQNAQEFCSHKTGHQNEYLIEM